jgi:hypothetical protein
LSSVEVLWAAAFEEVEVRGDNVSNELSEQAHAGDAPYVGVVKEKKGDATLYSIFPASSPLRGRPIGRKRKGRSAIASSLSMNASEPRVETGSVPFSTHLR